MSEMPWNSFEDEFVRFAERDFERSRRAAFWHRVRSVLGRRSDSLRSFDDVRAGLPFAGQRDAGVQTVRVDRIVGSMGRQRDFNSAFQPLHDDNRQRWMRVAYQEYRGSGLPPVELYRIGDDYYVQDGHHRVSVARSRGQLYIEAHVIEMLVPDEEIVPRCVRER